MIKDIFNSLKIGVRNLIIWFPIIWKDRNWDHSFILIILQHKLKFQSDYIEKRGVHLDAWADVRDMRLCIELIKKIQTEYYIWEYMEEYNETDPDSSDMYINKYPLIYKRVLNGEGIIRVKNITDAPTIMFTMGQFNHDRARKLLFTILENKLEGWWD